MIPVRWVGPQFAWHSLAHVNREFCLGLIESGKVELSILNTEPLLFTAEEDPRFARLQQRFSAPLSAPAAACVLHRFPPCRVPSDEGHFVLMQPWEYGYLPLDWVELVRQSASEVWCYSRYVRDVYEASGIPAELLHIVPLGIDERVFIPEVPPFIFTEEPGAQRAFRRSSKPFVFLFAGGTLYRKGFDILLDAYLRAFNPSDEVLLVVKDTCTRTVYRGQNARDQILRFVDDPAVPPIVYLDNDLTVHELAGVYTACDCLVQPYRGEGFCLPALEAMACGRPVIVTEGGPTDDFVDEAVGWRLPADRRLLESHKIGPFECVRQPWVFEVGVETLVERLRQVVQVTEEAKRRGLAAAKRARDEWTWRQAATVALLRLKHLSNQPRPQGMARWQIPFLEQRGTGEEPAAELTIPVQHEAQHAEQAPIVCTARGELTISLCMIVKNEERVLADCLTSAKPWFDEMIVVDTGSTDRTAQIAESFGAQVRQFPWIDSFAAARNESLRKAKGGWIFWMDADDTLPAETGQALRQAAASAPKEVVGFIVPVQFVDDGPGGGTRVDHVKLFRNLPGVAFEGRIHEQILPSLRAAGGVIARIDAVVLHSGYDTSPEGQAKKRERDRKLLALDLADTPDHPFKLFNCGMTEHYSGNHQAAIRWLEKSIQHSGPHDSHLRKAYVLLAVSHRELGEMEVCLRVLAAGLGVTPGDPELHFQMALTLTSQGSYAEAKEHYLKVLDADISSHFSSVDIGILGFKTYHNLGSLCRMMGDYPGARHWLQKALESAPSFLVSACELFDAALMAQDPTTAQQMLEIVQQVEGTSASYLSMAARYAEALEGPTAGERLLRQTVFSNPAAVEARLPLARLLLNTGRENEAREHLLLLSEKGIAEAAFYLGVAANRRGDFRDALYWMRRALVLNPAHSDTRSQVANLERVLQAAG